jgi:hypothetical protein
MRAALAAYEAALWCDDMAMAPRDGTPLLMVEFLPPHWVIVAWWVVGLKGWRSQGRALGADEDFTGWRHLPSLPVGGAEGNTQPDA